ncbi:MAG: hypothetical protein NT026_00590 [Candidatus Staskawiczbacteria bacterium]|nr:hypothetical protein [Candidatus Staskawiczbacteria bacterium]
MNKTKKIVISAALTALLLPVLALAYTAEQSTPTPGAVNLGQLVSNVVNKVWMVFAALAVVLFVYAGVKFLLAAGNPEKIQEARTAALWGVIGVVIMILAFAIFAIANSLISGV